MVRIAVLHESPRPTWTSRRLLEAIRSRGCRALYIHPSMLSAGVKLSCPVRYRGKCIDVDAVIVRSLGRGLSLEKFLYRVGVLEELEDMGVLVVNPSRAIRLARDKFASLRMLSKHGIPVPPTVVTEDVAEAIRVVQEWGRVVIKPLVGSLGLGSFMVDDADLAYRIISVIASLGQPIYIQKYVEKKGNRDIRAFVVGNRVVAAAYRVAPPGAWKTNVAQGAKAVPAELAPEVEELAVKAAKALDLIYSGVDIAESCDGGLYVFEANAAPLWRGLYQATGVDPAYHIVDHILELLRK